MIMANIIIINGPNLNYVGKREPNIYGNESFDVFFESLCGKYADVNLSYFQSNVEGEIINKIYECVDNQDGIIMNCGGYSHTSVAIADAMAAVDIPIVEVRISNIFAREEHRNVLLTAKNSSGFVSGFGLKSYEIALLALLNNFYKQ